jgi:hypothetical protein
MQLNGEMMRIWSDPWLPVRSDPWLPVRSGDTRRPRNLPADDQDPVCIQTDQYTDLHLWDLQKVQRTFGPEDTQINTRIPILEGMDD